MKFIVLSVCLIFSLQVQTSSSKKWSESLSRLFCCFGSPVPKRVSAGDTSVTNERTPLNGVRMTSETPVDETTLITTNTKMCYGATLVVETQKENTPPVIDQAPESINCVPSPTVSNDSIESEDQNIPTSNSLPDRMVAHVKRQPLVSKSKKKKSGPILKDTTNCVNDVLPKYEGDSLQSPSSQTHERISAFKSLKGFFVSLTPNVETVKLKKSSRF